MTLIIEDGSIVANANSYQTLDELRAYALARGVTLSAVDSELEIKSTLAVDYLESLAEKYQGSKTSSSQSLQFPRAFVYIDGNLLDANTIPIQLKKAQCELVMEISKGTNLMPTSVGLQKKKRKVDVLETEYFEGSGSIVPTVRRVDYLLDVLFSKNCAFMLSSVRS